MPSSGALLALGLAAGLTGSAVFAVPPGLTGAGDWWGRQLFA